jgi:pimeloyl-ACP methyl ester carboxylesterase
MRSRILASLAALLLVATSVHAQLTWKGATPLKPWEYAVLERMEGPALNLFIIRDSVKKPVVVLIQGSGCRPLFFKEDVRGRVVWASSVPARKGEGEYPVHFLTVEKRGVQSFGPVPWNIMSKGKDEQSLCGDEYKQGVDKETRVKDLVDAINAIAAEPWAGPIWLLGSSEGAEAAAGVAKAMGPKVEAVGMISGASPGRMYNFVASARTKHNNAGVQRWLGETRRLAEGKIEGDYLGIPVTSWTSFAIHSSPLEDLRGLPVPVFVAQGDADTVNVTPCADLLVAELMRDPGRSIFYLLLPGMDHALRGAEGPGVGREVVDLFLDWARTPDRPTGVALSLEEAAGMIKAKR